MRTLGRLIQVNEMTIQMAAYLLSILQRKLKLTATDLSRQQALKANLKAILQINFTGNLYRAGNTTVFFITEKVKEIFTRKGIGMVNLFHKFILILT